MDPELQHFEAALRSLDPRQGRLESVLRRLIRAWCRLVGWSIKVELAAPLPATTSRPGAGCVVAAAPHRTWIEPFLLLAAWPSDAARLVWLADARTVTRSWWRRRLLPRIGVLPVTPGSGRPQHYATLAAAAMRAGLAIAVFPEVGPPSPPDRARRVSPGFAYLALGAGAPVVPVVIGGTHHIVRGSSFSLRFGPALESGPAMDDPFDAAGRERAAALTGRLTEHLDGELPRQNAWTAARAPVRDRWRWLATLFG